GLQKGEDPALVTVARRLAAVTNPRDEVVSDQSIVALLAHRRVPGALADNSFMRFAAGTLSPADVEHVVESKPIAAVVVGRAFTNATIAPVLDPFLHRMFAHSLRLPGGTIYYGRR